MIREDKFIGTISIAVGRIKGTFNPEIISSRTSIQAKLKATGENGKSVVDFETKIDVNKTQVVRPI